MDGGDQEIAFEDTEPAFNVSEASVARDHLGGAEVRNIGQYSVRTERMLVEQMEYNLLFRWFVGFGIDERVFGLSDGRSRAACSDGAPKSSAPWLGHIVLLKTSHHGGPDDQRLQSRWRRAPRLLNRNAN
jgi:hypothetical protein